MKKLSITLLGIFMLAGVMAMYGGDTYTFETNLSNPVYIVSGNSSNLDGLNITFDSGNITISPAINYKPDSFVLTFFDNTTREIIETIYVGSGTRTQYVDKETIKYVNKNIPIYYPITENVSDKLPSNHSSQINKDVPDRIKKDFLIASILMIILIIIIISPYIYARFKK